MTKSNKTSNTLLLLTGAIAGAAATYYLQTPKGKKMRADIYNKSIEAKKELTAKAQIVAQNVSDKTQKAMIDAVETVGEIQEKIASSTNHLQENVETKLSSFQRGINQAKQTILNGEEV